MPHLRNAVVLLVALAFATSCSGFGPAARTGVEQRPRAAACSGLEECSWGPIADCVRLRLVVERKRVTVREPIRMRVEFENLAPHPVVLLRPKVLPIITREGDQPYGSKHGRNTIITAEETSGKHTLIRWNERALPPVSNELKILQPGARETITIEGVGQPLAAGDRPMGMRGAAHSDTRSVAAEFAYAHCHGTFRMVASYTADDPAAWRGSLRSQPVQIEVVEVASKGNE
jgi:hypothetical protein